MKVRSSETIEDGGCDTGVGPHVFKEQPVAHLQVRQVTLLYYVVGITSGLSPDTAGIRVSSGFCLCYT